MKNVFITAIAAVVISAFFAFRTTEKVTMIISHEVKNYSEWRKGFDADAASRAKMGVTISGVYQSVDNPNMITIVSEVPSLEAAKGFSKDPKLKASMEKAGVISAPEIKILTKTVK